MAKVLKKKGTSDMIPFITLVVRLFSHRVFITFLLYIFSFPVLSFTLCFELVSGLFFLNYYSGALSLFSLFFPRRILSLFPRLWCSSIPNIFFLPSEFFSLLNPIIPTVLCTLHVFHALSFFSSLFSVYFPGSSSYSRIFHFFCWPRASIWTGGGHTDVSSLQWSYVISFLIWIKFLMIFCSRYTTFFYDIRAVSYNVADPEGQL